MIVIEKTQTNINKSLKFIVPFTIIILMIFFSLVFYMRKVETTYKNAITNYLEKAIDVNSYAQISTEADKDRAKKSLDEFYSLKIEWLKTKVPKKYKSLDNEIIKFDSEMTRIIESLYEFNLNAYNASVLLSQGKMSGVNKLSDTSGAYMPYLMKSPQYVKIGKELLSKI